MYLRPHLSEGRYCSQSRRVPVWYLGPGFYYNTPDAAYVYFEIMKKGLKTKYEFNKQQMNLGH